MGATVVRRSDQTAGGIRCSGASQRRWDRGVSAVREDAAPPGHPDTPLFPGYLFLHYNLEEGGLQQLRKLPQLVGVVAFEGVVAAVPDST